MNNVIVTAGLFIVLISLGCSSQKPVFKSKTSFPYTESEFNLIVAMELLKIKHRRCTGKCDYSIESTFYYFDTCTMVILEHLKVKKSLLEKKINVPPGRYYVENFGTLTVFSHKAGDIPDFIFAPIIIQKKEMSFMGS